MPDEPRHDPAGVAREALARAREEASAKRRASEGQAAARRRADTRRANLADRPEREDRTPRAFGEAARELVGDRGWDAELAAAGVTADWPATVGAELAAHCRPRSLVRGTLTVEAESTAWATQIRLLSGQLLERVAAVAGEGVVRRLVVQGPTGPTWKHGRLSVPGRGPRDTYG